MFDWFNGKKTTISAVAWPILQLVTGQGWVTGTAATILTWGLTAWTGGALGHKAVKAKK